MASEVVVSAEVKCRVTRIDSTKPKKELNQRYETIKIKTDPIDYDEWWARKFIAAWILQEGFDMFF